MHQGHVVQDQIVSYLFLTENLLKAFYKRIQSTMHRPTAGEINSTGTNAGDMQGLEQHAGVVQGPVTGHGNTVEFSYSGKEDNLVSCNAIEVMAGVLEYTRKGIFNTSRVAQDLFS